MTNNKQMQFKARVDDLLASGRLGDAFDELRSTARSMSAWSVSDRIDRAEQGYGYMLRYLLDGVADPSREELYVSLLHEAASIRDTLIRMMASVDTPTLYYNTLRSIGIRQDESLQSLFDSYRKANESMSPFNSLSIGSGLSESDRLRLEMAERDIFNRLWVTYPLNVDEIRLTMDFIDDESVADSTKALVISAVTLGLLEFFDERRFEMLMDAYMSKTTALSVRALIGLVLALDKYKGARLSQGVLNRLETLRESADWKSDIAHALVEIIRTNDTERISGKLKNEIFPQIKKMGQDLAERIKDTSADVGAQTAEINPEWENLLSNEKVRDNLKELGELQQEGGDVFMATFAGLKQFPFFNDVANWFIPYRADHSAVSSSGINGMNPIAMLVDNAPFVCDSDKYSMMLSLSMMPENQRSMMASQIDNHHQELEEAAAMSENALRPVERRGAINNYVLSIYRFYRLFRRKGEFYNPFGSVINPVDIPALRSDFSDEDTLVTLGEFYFKIGLYDYSRKIFDLLDSIVPPDASRYQKLGFCCEKLGDDENAASYYEQADLLDGRNTWNLRRLSSVLRRTGRVDEAISVGKRLEGIMPDDMSAIMNLGYLYIRAGRYDEAIEQFHKAEFIDETSVKPLRPLAWALFLNREYESAESYYGRILADSPTSGDYLNMGHLSWAKGRLGDAVRYYKSSGLDQDALVRSITDDKSYLDIAGVDTSTMPMLIDAMIYSMKH